MLYAVLMLMLLEKSIHEETIIAFPLCLCINLASLLAALKGQSEYQIFFLSRWNNNNTDVTRRNVWKEVYLVAPQSWKHACTHQNTHHTSTLSDEVTHNIADCYFVLIGWLLSNPLLFLTCMFSLSGFIDFFFLSLLTFYSLLFSSMSLPPQCQSGEE